MTASGFLVHEGKVLLIKHKKLGIWLAPGGHTEEEELPHESAEREFWEETGVKVRAVSAAKMLRNVGKTSYHPVPFAVNLHWISRENYKARLKNTDPTKRVSSEKWSRGCEQHVVLVYLVEPVDGIEFKQNVEETDGISWFGLEDLKNIETIPEIKEEAQYALEHTGAKE
jgi:8-oxo-dGTP pyrophosphatase MutT (NUDIX family)